MFLNKKWYLKKEWREVSSQLEIWSSEIKASQIQSSSHFNALSDIQKLSDAHTHSTLYSPTQDHEVAQGTHVAPMDSAIQKIPRLHTRRMWLLQWESRWHTQRSYNYYPSATCSKSAKNALIENAYVLFTKSQFSINQERNLEYRYMPECPCLPYYFSDCSPLNIVTVCASTYYMQSLLLTGRISNIWVSRFKAFY